MNRKQTAKSWVRRLILVGIVLALIPIMGLYTLSAMSKQPDNLGVTNGQLTACPDTPNCVSSQATDPSQRIDPVPYEGDITATMEAVIAAVLNQPRTKIVTETDDYFHAESTSLIFRFVDDVEFYFDDDAKLIHFRSASRIGRSDLGANQKRIKQILNDFQNRR